MVINQPTSIKLKMWDYKLKSGVNWQGVKRSFGVNDEDNGCDELDFFSELNLVMILY
jgi:hypothetical protein